MTELRTEKSDSAGCAMIEVKSDVNVRIRSEIDLNEREHLLKANLDR